MKNLLFMLLCMLMPAAWAVDLELGGQHRTQGVFYQGDGFEQDMDKIFTQRFKLKGIFSPNEMFESRFWMITNFNWGSSENEGIRIYGYGDAKISDELMVRVGRTPYEIGSGSSLSINKYEKYPYALDGAFVTYNTDSVSVDVWGAFLPKVYHLNTEVDRYKAAGGVVVDIHAVDILDAVTLHGIYAMKANKEDGTAGEDHIRVGGDLGGETQDIGYKVSGVAHVADFTGDTQYAVDAKLYYNAPADVRVFVGGHYETDGYDAFYHNRRKGAGWLDVAALGGGTVYGKAGVSYSPFESLKVGLIGIYFQNIGSWGLWSHGAKENSLNSKDVVEASLFLKKNFAGGFKFKLNGGAFDVLADKLYWQVQMNVMFNF